MDLHDYIVFLKKLKYFIFIRFISNLSKCFHYTLGLHFLHIISENQLTDWLKNKFILWKLSFIWMKILNDIACNWNWIEFKYIEWNLNSIWIQFNNFSNSIEEKWDANWWRRYWKYACEYDLIKNNNFFFKKKTLKDINLERHVCFHVSLFKNGLKTFQFGTIQMMIYDSWNLKLSYLTHLQWIINIKF